jgi:hypothetical protein
VGGGQLGAPRVDVEGLRGGLAGQGRALRGVGGVGALRGGGAWGSGDQRREGFPIQVKRTYRVSGDPG